MKEFIIKILGRDLAIKRCHLKREYINVEVLDLLVFRSNDWNRYIPDFILVESINDILEEIMLESLYQFLKKKGYILIAKTHRTLILKNIIF